MMVVPLMVGREVSLEDETRKTTIYVQVVGRVGSFLFYRGEG